MPPNGRFVPLSLLSVEASVGIWDSPSLRLPQGNDIFRSSRGTTKQSIEGSTGRIRPSSNNSPYRVIENATVVTGPLGKLSDVEGGKEGSRRERRETGNHKGGPQTLPAFNRQGRDNRGWSVTSAALGTQATLYARTTQTDLAGNSGTATAGPLSTP